MITLLAKLLKALNAEAAPGQISAALCLAMFFAFMPLISLQQPDIGLDSDIDNTLKATLKKTIDRQRAELESSLRQTISEQTKGQIQDVQGGFSGLDAIEQKLQQRLNVGSEVMPG